MKSALDVFLLDCESRRLTEETLDFYGRCIRPFVEYCATKGVTDVTDVTASHVRSFLISLEKKELSGSTQHAYARSLRAWFNFLVREEWLSRTPMKNVAMPKREQRVMEALTEDQVKALLSVCRTLRDEAMLLFLVDSGVRITELVELNVEDVDLQMGTVIVLRGKGRKERQVYIGVKTRKALSRYLMGRKKSGSGPLFLSFNTDERLTRRGAALILKRMGAATGIHVSPHMLRRTFALWSLRSGMNIYVLQRLMGHSDLGTLKRYLRLSEADDAEASRKHGAVDRLL